MEKKNRMLILGVLLVLLVGVIGISFAYFTSGTTVTGEGGSTEIQTVTLDDTVVTMNGKVSFNDLNIYPGHQNLSVLELTATGNEKVIYNLQWVGTNTLKTPINYTIYKTTTEQNPTITCNKQEEGNLTTIYYETCTKTGFDTIGSIISRGTIEESTTEATINLIRNEEIQATSGGAKTYYYVVLEYPNSDEVQNIDFNGRLNGTVRIIAIDKKETAQETILSQNIIDESRISGEFTSAFEENTSGKIFKGPSDDYGDTTYFYAGSNPNNWVKFGQENGKDIYWRIIRVNGNGTIRMIYNGTTTDQTGTGTQISNDGGTTTTYAFNTNSNDNAYVGYMYGTAGSDNYNDTHANTNSSNIKTQVDIWYNTNLNKDGIKEHIDTNVGFCGDRAVASESQIWWSDGTKKGYGTNATAYGPFSRVLTLNLTYNTPQKPTYKCSQSNDLYTVSGANNGNKALTYPIGLITMDEIVFAGGFGGPANNKYYLYTNQAYWTMSPEYISKANGNALIFLMGPDGGFGGNYVTITIGARPVINLKAETLFSSGNGTTSNPFIVR